MKVYQLAFRHLCRKKSKTFILLLVLLFINSMILGSYMILHATEDSLITMQEKWEPRRYWKQRSTIGL